MVPGGSTELIWHFAGHMHLAIEEARARLDYTEGALKALSSDYTAQLPFYNSPADLNNFYTYSPPPPEALIESATSAHSGPRKSLVDKFPKEKFAPPSRDELEKTLVHPSSGGGGGGGGELKISVTYDDGSSQLQTDIHQLNMVSDDDVFGVSRDHVDSAYGSGASAQIQDMLDAANAQIPAEIAIPLTGSGAVIEFIKEQDAARADQGQPDGEPIEPGLHINGVLQPADATRPETPVVEETLPDLEAKGQWAELGGNITTNAAVIVDLNEAAPTLIVMGDFFKTNAFVQTNAFVDNDKVYLGDQLPDVLLTGDNKADNIAEFVQNNGVHGVLEGHFSGLQWNVDVLEGDVYDINLLVQENHLKDNDIVAQTNNNTHFMLIAGENGAYNLIDIASIAANYDAIIIGGSGHNANLIFQTNILLDSDILKLVAEGDLPAFQSGITGQNALLNDATIVTYGNDIFQPVTDDMKDLVAALDSGQTSLDTDYGELIPRNGPGPLNVLYIKGEFFDINAIWQINVVADLDTALQLLSAAGADGDPTQMASTGGNELTNLAAIVDVGSTFAFVDGEVYDDAILVQANLVTGDEDVVVNKDTDTLVTEIIAFTGADESESASEGQFQPVPIPHDDMMGSVLT